MVFVADILGLPLAWWLFVTGGGAATAFWFLGCVDDAELSVFGCPSCFASADEHNWEALQHRTPSAEPLGGKASLGRRSRLAVVSRVLSERYDGLCRCLLRLAAIPESRCSCSRPPHLSHTVARVIV